MKNRALILLPVPVAAQVMDLPPLPPSPAFHRSMWLSSAAALTTPLWEETVEERRASPECRR